MKSGAEGEVSIVMEKQKNAKEGNRVLSALKSYEAIRAATIAQNVSCSKIQRRI